MKVTTIMVTRGRVDLLARAIRALDQQIAATIDLHVVIDDCHATLGQPIGIVAAVSATGWRIAPKRVSGDIVIRSTTADGTTTNARTSVSDF